MWKNLKIQFEIQKIQDDRNKLESSYVYEEPRSRLQSNLQYLLLSILWCIMYVVLEMTHQLIVHEAALYKEAVIHFGPKI